MPEREITRTNAHVQYWDEMYERYQEELGRLEELIQSFESDTSIILTRGAVQILLIPIVEDLENGTPFDYAMVADTLRKLSRHAAAKPDSRDAHKRHRSSWSIFKAIADLWCNIPPFCSES